MRALDDLFSVCIPLLLSSLSPLPSPYPKLGCSLFLSLVLLCFLPIRSPSKDEDVFLNKIHSSFSESYLHT